MSRQANTMEVAMKEVVNVRFDPVTLNEFRALAKRLGMAPSTLVRVAAQAWLRKQHAAGRGVTDAELEALEMAL